MLNGKEILSFFQETQFQTEFAAQLQNRTNLIQNLQIDYCHIVSFVFTPKIQNLQYDKIIQIINVLTLRQSDGSSVIVSRNVPFTPLRPAFDRERPPYPFLLQLGKGWWIEGKKPKKLQE